VDFEDPVFIRQAARLGVFAYISQEDFADLQSSIDIVLCRFAEYRNLEGAFVRRAVTERAKGVLMERHGVTHHASSAMLDARAQASGRRVVEIAEAILVSCNILSSGNPR
jgi:response regulator NasT